MNTVELSPSRVSLTAIAIAGGTVLSQGNGITSFPAIDSFHSRDGVWGGSKWSGCTQFSALLENRLVTACKQRSKTNESWKESRREIKKLQNRKKKELEKQRSKNDLFGHWNIHSHCCRHHNCHYYCCSIICDTGAVTVGKCFGTRTSYGILRERWRSIL